MITTIINRQSVIDGITPSRLDENTLSHLSIRNQERACFDRGTRDCTAESTDVRLAMKSPMPGNILTILRHSPKVLNHINNSSKFAAELIHGVQMHQN